VSAPAQGLEGIEPAEALLLTRHCWPAWWKCAAYWQGEALPAAAEAQQWLLCAAHVLFAVLLLLLLHAAAAAQQQQLLLQEMLLLLPISLAVVVVAVMQLDWWVPVGSPVLQLTRAWQG